MATERSRHFRIERLSPGVYAAVARDGGAGVCNAGIVDLGSETLVFDTMVTPGAGADLARAAERATGHRPSWVVNSHWHGDHIWGNSSFVGSHIVSSRTVRANIRSLSRRQFESDRRAMRVELRGLDRPGSPYAVRDRPAIRGWFEGVVATPRSFRIVPPDVTFDDGLVLEGTRRSVELWTYGGGHSPSDVFAYLPEERTVFGGDLVPYRIHPSVGDGWPSRWVGILDRISRLRIEQIVPGHGVPAPRAAIAETRGYLVELERIVRRAAAARLSDRDLRETPVPSKYRDWGFSVMFADNLSRVRRLVRARSG